MGPHLSPTQRSSAAMERAVFADPELRERFEKMAHLTTVSAPTLDSFDWLVPAIHGNAAKPVNTDLNFEDVVKALLSVDPDDLPDKAKSPSQPDRSQSAPGS